jgi:nucleoside-diphosphate-sugar epimerase
VAESGARKTMKGRNFKRESRDSRVLVLGGAGYLGSVLVGQLLAAGWRVRVLDSFMFGEQSLDQVRSHANCELVRGDVRDIGVVARCMKGCGAVIHLAAIVGDSACEENEQLAAEVNRAATRMLTEVALDCGVRRFLFASSCSVYGASESFADERGAVNPLSMYAEMKVESERILLGARSARFAPTILRLSTLFGLSPRMRFDLVVNLFVARAVSLGSITISNGAQWRPLMHVGDAARAFMAVLDASTEKVSGEVFNAGSTGLNLRIEELGRAVADEIPGIVIQTVASEDRRNYRVAFNKIRERLRFNCRRTVEYGIQEIYRAIRAGLIRDFTTANFNNQIALRALVRAGAKQSAPLSVVNEGAGAMVVEEFSGEARAARVHAAGL